MKKSLILFCALAIMTVAKVSSQDFSVISGKITNEHNGALGLLEGNSFMGRPVSNINVSKDGTFSDTLRVKEGIYKIMDGKNIIPIYVKNGNNIVINYDTEDFQNSLIINGKGSIECKFLLEQHRIVFNFNRSAEAIYSLEETKFKEKLAEYKASQEALLNIRGISNHFVILQKKIITYNHLLALSQYEQVHAHFTKNENFKVSEEFLKELNELDYSNEEDYFLIYEYQSLVFRHYLKQASELIKKDPALKQK